MSKQEEKVKIVYIEVKRPTYTATVKRAMKKYYEKNKDELAYKSLLYWHNVTKPFKQEFKRLCQIEI